MFDTVGTTRDAEAGRRSLASALISALALGSALAFVTAVGAYTAVVRPVPPPAPDDGAIVELILDEPALTPDLPAPPPPPAAAAPEPDPTPETPDELVDDPPVLDEPIERPLADGARPAGDPDGVTDGHPDGEVGGVRNGTPGGDPDGRPGGGGPAHVHHSEIVPRVRVLPDYPAAAEAMALGEQVCKVTVTMDGRGVPSRAEVAGCPAVFHAGARDALLRWRWMVPRSLGRESALQTVIAVRFVPR